MNFRKLASYALAITLGISAGAFAALETGTYISDLTATNPTSGDPVSQADDHIRLVKSTVKATFPNVAGAVTPTHTELNFVDGVTSAIQTQLDQSKVINGTAVASTSGTSIDFTSIPSWVKSITITVSALSTTGTSPPMIQIGDSGGVENSGYSGAVWSLSAGSGASLSAGFTLFTTFGAATIINGQVKLTLQDSATNTWVADSQLSTDSNNLHLMAGAKSLSATLDRVRITTVGGTETFDAGKVNIQYN